LPGVAIAGRAMEKFAVLGFDSVGIAHSERAADTNRDASNVVPGLLACWQAHPWLYTQAGHQETTNADNVVTGAGSFSLSCFIRATSRRLLGMRFVCAR
jgi:hypothetical protein